MANTHLTEAQLEAIEARASAEDVPHLVSTIRGLQHELERLGSAVEVLRRDREELRAALLHRQAKDEG